MVLAVHELTLLNNKIYNHGGLVYTICIFIIILQRDVLQNRSYAKIEQTYACAARLPVIS